MQNNTSRCTNDTRFLRLPEVIWRVGLGKTTIYEYIKRKQFPAPHKPSDGTSVWISDEITAWMNRCWKPELYPSKG